MIDDLSLEELKQLREVIQALLDFSSAAIIKGNFVKAFYDNTINGRLYGNFTLFGAKSFRLTSNSPNLLNLPATGSIYAKPVKKCLEAKQGYIWYMVDLNA